MKNILLFILLSLFCHEILAQRQVEENIPLNAKSLVLSLRFAQNISIRFYDGNEAQIKGSVNLNDNQANDKFSLVKKVEGNEIRLYSELNDLDEIAPMKTFILQEKYQKNSYNQYTWTDGDYIIERGRQISAEINYEILLPKNANVRLENYSAKTKIEGTNPGLKVKSISGDIEMLVNAGESLNFRVKNINGNVFSDLNFELDSEKDPQRIGGGKFEQSLKLNQGTQEVYLETISGNIYLRKR